MKIYTVKTKIVNEISDIVNAVHATPVNTKVKKSTSIQKLSLIGLSMIVWSCSSLNPKASDADKSTGNKPAAQDQSTIDVSSYRVTDAEPEKIIDKEIQSIPVEINPLVEKWIAYFQGRGRPHMERYLSRSTRYVKLMKRILRENGLPDDLIYIALIESGFSSRAVSHASAVGYWQFIKPTGRRYNLEVSSLIDERRDPVLSTQAASGYFKDLYGMFGSWYLAMAAYNSGENRIQRAINKNYTRDFWKLAAKRKALPKETVHYVPKFIAAKLIAESPENYGFTDIEYEKPFEFEKISIDHAVDLKVMAEALGMDYDEFRLLNPKYKGAVAPVGPNSILDLRVPVGKVALALEVAPQAKVDMSQIAYYKAEDIQTYRVKRGDTLSKIAKKFKTSTAIIRELNDIRPNKRLRVGMRIDLPKKRSSLSQSKNGLVLQSKTAENTRVKSTNRVALKVNSNNGSEESEVAAEEARPKFYVVRKGDTLTGIAEEYEVTVGELVKLNKLKKRSHLMVGKKLKLPDVEDLPSAISEKEALRPSLSKKSPDRRIAGNKSKLRPEPRAKLKSRAGSANSNTRKSLVTQAKNKVTQSARLSQMVQKKYHLVKKGEHLTLIANRYGLSVSKLSKMNKISDPSEIQAGQRIVISSF